MSALLDGQLPAAEEQRWWEHVHGCPACRDLAGREGWVKTRLAGLGDAPAPGRGPRPAQPGSAAPRGRGRRAALLLAGTGAAAGTLGVALLVVGPGADPGAVRPPASSLTGLDGGPRGPAARAGAADEAGAPQPVRSGHRFVPAVRAAP